MFRYPLSIWEVPGSRDTEVSCHVHRVSVRVSRDDDEFASTVAGFMDEHRDCATAIRLPTGGRPDVRRSCGPGE